MTFDGTNTFTFDYRNRLQKAVNSQHTTTYSYDVFDRRTGKTVDGVTTNTLLDGSQESADYDGSGNLLRRYVYGRGIDELLVMVVVPGSSEKRYYHHHDGLGSVVFDTDDKGGIHDQQAYGPWGEGVNNATGTPFRYTGRRFDPETGLYYYRARYYNPNLGRFLSPDPANSDPAHSSYAYAGNDPVDNTDPTGMEDRDGQDGGGGSVYDGGGDIVVTGSGSRGGGSVYDGGGDIVVTGHRRGYGGGDTEERDVITAWGQRRALQSTQAACKATTFSGDATYYNLKGNTTASGQPFDPNSNNAAMYQPGQIHLGDSLTVQLQNSPHTSITVTVNDSGPFARGPNGLALHPLQPDPNIVIDLTPQAFTNLAGGLAVGRVPVNVTKNGGC